MNFILYYLISYCNLLRIPVNCSDKGVMKCFVTLRGKKFPTSNGNLDQRWIVEPGNSANLEAGERSSPGDVLNCCCLDSDRNAFVWQVVGEHELCTFCGTQKGMSI